MRITSQAACQPLPAVLALLLQIGLSALLQLLTGGITLAAVLFLATLNDQLQPLAFVAIAPAFPFAVFIVQVLVLVLVKWIVVGRLRPGRHAIWSLQFHRWWFLSNYMKSILGSNNIFSSTPYAGHLLRALGARIGQRVVMDATQMMDPDFLQIGDDVLLGGVSPLMLVA